MSSVFSPFAKYKKERLKQVLKFIAENKKVEVNRLIGKFCIDWGITQKKVLQYIDELKAAGYVITETVYPENVYAEPITFVAITNSGKEAAEKEEW